jgi:hypothetical protein
MRLRKKPIKPKRRKGMKVRLGCVSPYDLEGALDDVITQLESYRNKDGCHGIYLEADHHYYEGIDSFEIFGYRDETEEEYNRRLASYKRKLKEYAEWYKNNKKAIDEEIARREANAEAKRLAKIKKLQKELEKHETTLARKGTRRTS